MLEGAIDLILRFVLDGVEVSSWRFSEGIVSSGNSLNANSSKEDFVRSLELISDFIKKVDKVIGSVPFASLSPNIVEKLKVIDGSFKWELTIGNLSVELMYCHTPKTISVNRTSFSLSWSDFIYFIERYKAFRDRYIERIGF